MDDLHDDLAAHVADELASGDGGQLAPLSDARLAEIQRTWRFFDYDYDSADVDAIKDLLAHVDWLRECEAALLAERERLLAVVRAVAEAEADNSDHGVCYQLCQYTHIWTSGDGEWGADKE